MGDDTTDLDAFRALAELVKEGKLTRAVRVGVGSEEGPTAITGEADIVVDGTAGVRDLLSLLDRSLTEAVRFSDFLRTTVLISAAVGEPAGGDHAGLGRFDVLERRPRPPGRRRLVAAAC